MSMVFNGDLDLGGYIEFQRAMQEMGHIEPGEEPYGRLFGAADAIDADDTDLHPDYIAKVKTEAAAFLKQHGKDLSKHTIWILQQLATYEHPPKAQAS